MNQNKIDEARWCMEGLVYDLDMDTHSLTERDLLYIAEQSLKCTCKSSADCSVEEYHEAVKQFINENLKEL